MMNNHTKGKLVVSTDRLSGNLVANCGVGADGITRYLMSETMANYPGSTESDARRLVGCWNACLELETDDIENAGRFESPVEALRASNRKLEQQRDKLLQDMKRIRDHGSAKFKGEFTVAQIATDAIIEATK